MAGPSLTATTPAKRAFRPVDSGVFPDVPLPVERERPAGRLLVCHANRRMEARLALGALLERSPDPELATPTLRYRESLLIRGVAELPVRLVGAC
jgi:hypothetical protein